MLNHAAAVSLSSRLLRTLAPGVAFTALVVLVAATPAAALDGIDLSEEPEPLAYGECPRLVQIKYPFLSCIDGNIGLASGDDTWENSRQLPRQFPWTEGGGAFGPNLNQD